MVNFIIKQYLNQKNLKILEIGPGLGVNLNLLTKYGNVDILEIDDYFIEQIQNNFQNIKTYRDIKGIKSKFDLIVLLDVLEHIEDVNEFTTYLSDLLSEDGYVILSVPAYEFLFSDHDALMKHFRRYNVKLLKYHLSEKFKILKIYRFNSFLLPLRILQIKLLNFPTSDVKTNIFTNLIFKTILNFEHLLRICKKNFPFEISIFCIIKKINMRN